MSDPPVRELLRRALGARVAARLARVPLRDLGVATVSELVATYRLSETAAERTVAVLELGRLVQTEPMPRGAAFKGSADVYRAYGPKMRDLKVEQFWVVLLDGKHRVIGEVLVSQGTLSASPVHPREVFAPAIRMSAAAIALVHNHPSGDPSPSADDLEITRRLSEVGTIVGIRVVDHIVIGDGAYASLADRGLL